MSKKQRVSELNRQFKELFNASKEEGVIRQLVDRVKVLLPDRIMLCLRGGMEIEQGLNK